MEEVSGLSPMIMHFDSWPFKKWRSESGGLYYSHSNEPGRCIHDDHAYSMIDTNLKILSYFLHANGLEVTPSCQGHFYTRTELRRAWDKIKKEESKIRRVGVVVIDSENGEERLFKNQRYELPWNDFKQYNEEEGEKLKQGFIGIIVPKKLEAIWKQLKENPFNSKNTKISEVFSSYQFGETSEPLSLFSVTVKSQDPKERDYEWKQITQYFYKLFKGATIESQRNSKNLV